MFFEESLICSRSAFTKMKNHCLQNKSHFIVKASLIELRMNFYLYKKIKISLSIKVLQLIIKTL